MEKENSFLGKGWSFPPHFTKAEKGVKMIADEDDIQNSLQVLLFTRVGERLMQPGYGCNLDVMIFEPINLSLETYIKDLVFNAIYLYEPRIKPDNVELSPDYQTGIVEIKIDYSVRATNARHNLVFPFYTGEATLAGIENI